ncbi:MAG: hypothetical protein CM15mP47_3650 [Methanobacteriota archaeon]|nr:MAG: hypothetical protein CM15mP47_3650 [Euryarchaeota archaeon]
MQKLGNIQRLLSPGAGKLGKGRYTSRANFKKGAREPKKWIKPQQRPRKLPPQQSRLLGPHLLKPKGAKKAPAKAKATASKAKSATKSAAKKTTDKAKNLAAKAKETAKSRTDSETKRGRFGGRRGHAAIKNGLVQERGKNWGNCSKTECLLSGYPFRRK